MIAVGCIKPGVLYSIMTSLGLGAILSAALLPMCCQGATSISNNETAKDRVVVKNPEYQGSIFANQISLSTDKPFYKEGEKINFTITNTGIRPIHFSVLNSNIEIKNLKSNETFFPSTMLESSTIPSGGIKVVTWDQKEFTDRQVQPGQYSGKVTSGSLSSNITFYIK
jgi:hypothetical protein